MDHRPRRIVGNDLRLSQAPQSLLDAITESRRPRIGLEQTLVGTRHRLALWRHFVDKVEADRALTVLHHFAEVLVRARLDFGIADLQHVLGGGRLIEVRKLLARPGSHNLDRGGRGKAVALGLAEEMDLDGDAPAVMAVDVPVTIDLQDLDGPVDVDRFMDVATVVGPDILLKGSRISAANIGPKRFHQKRTVSWQMSIPRSARRSSTLRSERGYFTYIITTRRITSGDELK